MGEAIGTLIGIIIVTVVFVIIVILFWPFVLALAGLVLMSYGQIELGLLLIVIAIIGGLFSDGGSGGISVPGGRFFPD